MEKKKILNFISKYNLSGLVNKVKITNNKGKLVTSFKSDDKSVAGFLAYDKIELGDNIEFGVFNSNVWIKMLNALDSDITIKLHEERGKFVYLEMYDANINSKLMLADLSIIDNIPENLPTPDSDIDVDITPEFIDLFMRAKTALSEANVMAFKVVNGKLTLIINYSDHNTDTITLDIADTKNDIPVLKFNSDVFKEVLSANKDFTTGVISLSQKGLMTIKFKSAEFQSKYLLVMLQ